MDTSPLTPDQEGILTIFDRVRSLAVSQSKGGQRLTDAQVHALTLGRLVDLAERRALNAAWARVEAILDPATDHGIEAIRWAILGGP